MRSVNRSELFAKPEVQQALVEMEGALRSALPDASFAEREAAALAISDEAVRSLLENDLRTLSESFGEQVLIDGVLYKRHQPGNGTYHSLSGPLHVPRHSFRQVGIHNGPIVIALELEAGIIEGATPALAYNIAHGYARHDMRLHEEELETAHRQPPSRSTLERIAKRIAKAGVDNARRIQAQLRRVEAVPDGAVAAAIGLDRTSALMVEKRPEDAPAKPEPKRTKPYVRQPPEPFDLQWRMAYVGTVSFLDADGETLAVRRYAAAAGDDPRNLVLQMTADLRSSLKQNPALIAGIVQDGAHEMWNRTREGMQTLRDEGLLETWQEGIDFCHLLGHLASALEIIEPDAAARKQKLDAWRDELEMRDSAIDGIERFLIRHYGDLEDSKQREALWEHLAFVANNKDRMRYVSLRVAGLPIGSGVTESSAKTVIAWRAKGAGQRWSEPGLRGALTLRALHQSDRLPRFWSHLARRYVARIEAA